MKMKGFILLFLFSLIVNISYSQSSNRLYIDKKSYQASPSVSFQYGNDFLDEKRLDIVFAKKDDGSAYLYLSAKKDLCDVPFGDEIKGAIFLYLDNGEVVKCIDRKMNDDSDCFVSNIYSLTISEIEKLKRANIIKIRFSKGYNSYTASSEYYREDFGGKKIEKVSVLTIDIVLDLFD